MTIIGVNPPAFTGAYEVQNSPDIFLPFSMQPIAAPKSSASLLTDRNLWWVLLMGRLKPGVTAQTAQAALNVELNATIRATMVVGKNDEFMTFAIHTWMQSETIVPSLRAAVASIDRDLPLLDMRTQDEQIEDRSKVERTFASLTSGFGLLALVLACIGIYGLMAYSVARRTNEIGIRMALGAQSGRVQRMILREASLLAVVGVAAGLAVGVAMSRLIATMLYGLKSYDPLTFSGASLLLLFVALSASWIPARRAARIDPLKALRHE
jgi:hypothetical protein